VLVSIGRVPYTEGSGWRGRREDDNKGRVIVDAHFATNVPASTPSAT
jgi:pyruvate/2-oxoglutarate dehydrogenase complex dihydrolipoamide dehydrogenase (E3) component